MGKKHISVLGLLLASVFNVNAIDKSKLDDICSEVFPEGQPGAAVLVMKGNRTVFEKCYGIADIETGARITPNTSFNIASVSKQFTAVAVLQLCEQGRISVDDKVTKYFPEFTDRIWDKIRIRHLLSHSSGIPDARDGYTREERIFADENRALEFLPKLNYLHFEPGTQYEYMNPTFVLLGRLVERVTGEEFTEYVTKHIFAPAGMRRTVYFDPKHQERIPNLSHGYRSDKKGGWKEYDYGEETFFATRPDGGIYTSIREFAKWEKAQRTAKVLKKATLEDAQSPHTKVTGSRFSDYQNRENTWYGYGWFIEPQTAGSEKVVYHTGDNGGYKIIAARYPASNTLILIFANRRDWDRYELLRRLEEVVLSKK